MADDEVIQSDEPFLTAGELALGVLEGSELAAARRLQLSDVTFAAAVEWWEARLGAMSEGARSALPSDAVWQGIVARIDAIDAQRDMPAAAAMAPVHGRGPAGWSIAAALVGVSAAAAALVLFLSTPATSPVAPPEIAAVAGDQLVAQLTDAEANRSLASRIDPESGQLRLAIAGLEAEPGKTPELWVIPAGGGPISLGAIPQQGNFARDLSVEESSLLAAGATLAVTFEDDTGERHETPTMPILLAGPLAEV